MLDFKENFINQLFELYIQINTPILCTDLSIEIKKQA